MYRFNGAIRRKTLYNQSINQSINQSLACHTNTSVYNDTRTYCDRSGGVEVERSPIMREIGVRSPVATDPKPENR